LLFSRSATTVRLSISLAYNCRKSPSSRFAPRYSLHFDFKADFGVTMKELITSITVHKQALCLRQRKEAAVVEVRSSPTPVCQGSNLLLSFQARLCVRRH
jgi:hypothetical protein